MPPAAGDLSAVDNNPVAPAHLVRRNNRTMCSGGDTLGPDMDGLIAGIAWLLKAAAVVSATLVAWWCVFMFFYTHPEWWGSDLFRDHFWWSSAVALAVLAGTIGGSTVAATRSFRWAAWAMVPGLWMGAAWLLLFV